jgi:protein phosphatase
MVADDEIHRIVLAAGSPQEACQKLVQAANQAGGEDNISVVVVQVEAVG